MQFFFSCVCLLQHEIHHESLAVFDINSYLKTSADWSLFCFSIVQLYRLERYNECKSVYTDLIRNSQDEYEEERKTNLAAVVASISQWEDAPLVSTQQLRTINMFCLFDCTGVYRPLFICFSLLKISSLLCFSLETDIFKSNLK